jgi:heptosyltransferase-2
MTKKILIIKLGALGDVIRTTPLLRVLQGDITWVTSRMAMPLLTNNPYISKLVAADAPDVPLDPMYELVVNLEDDINSAELASTANAETIIGPYLDGLGVTYQPQCSEWFDMSLSSRYGLKTADRLKMQNRKAYQAMVFSAVGATFSGEEPVLNLPLQKALVPGLVGIEERAGGVWPNKRWKRYQELAVRLESLGHKTRFFRQRESLIDYADDINECEFVICGDTLAMHIALALGKRVVALFTCTSPHEIYGYGRLHKVVSPLLDEYFYKREYSPEPADAISTDEVEEGFRLLAGDCNDRHTVVAEGERLDG